MIWKIKPTLELLNSTNINAMPSNLGIKFIEVGDDFITATMPVDHRTVQPFRILHGGASVALAETLGSVASMFCLENTDIQSAVGVEINANHLSSAQEGDAVKGTVKPIKIGKRLHVWEIKMFRSDGRLICVSRLTVAVVEKRM